jgi:hypothetical protein
MTRLGLIKELEHSIKQLKDMGQLGKEVTVMHSVCTGGYGGDYREIDQLGLEFNLEEDGNVLVMDYSVVEI